MPLKLSLHALLKVCGVATVDFARRELNIISKKNFSWNTIKKYLDILVSEGKLGLNSPGEPSDPQYKRARPHYFIGDSFSSAMSIHMEYCRAKARMEERKDGR